jgi:hypothetical protein
MVAEEVPRVNVDVCVWVEPWEVVGGRLGSERPVSPFRFTMDFTDSMDGRWGELPARLAVFWLRSKAEPELLFFLPSIAWMTWIFMRLFRWQGTLPPIHEIYVIHGSLSRAQARV